MAFGDIIQKTNGGSGDSATLTGVGSGNSLVFISRYRAFESGFPTSVSDSLNSGSYEKFLTAGTEGSENVQGHFLSGSDAGTVVLSFSDATPYNWALFEIEGTIQVDVAQKTAISETAVSSVSVPSATVSADSFSVAAINYSKALTNISGIDAGWTKEFDLVPIEFFHRKDSASSTVGLAGAMSQDSAYAAGWASFTESSASPTAPTITDINTTNEVTPGTTATLTGTNLTNATGLNIGSEAQTDFTVVSATEVTFTVVRGGNPYNQDLTATLLSPDGNATITVQQVPAADELAVTAADPNTTDEDSFWSGLIDTITGDPVTIVDGDQALAYDFADLEGENVSFGIDPTGNITAEFTGTFKAIIRLASEGTWGSEQTVSFAVPGDPEPDQTNLTAKKKQNDRRRYAANCYGAWRNRFR